MPLEFPTLAEKVHAEYLATGKPICHLIKGLPVNTYRVHFPRHIITHYFDDDTSIEISGAGKNYKVETFYP